MTMMILNDMNIQVVVVEVGEMRKKLSAIIKLGIIVIIIIIKQLATSYNVDLNWE